MSLSRRSFLASLVAVFAAPLAWTKHHSIEWRSRWWSSPPQPQRLYFSSLFAPTTWDDEYGYDVHRIHVEPSVRDGWMLRLEPDGITLLVSSNLLERARTLFPQAVLA